MINTVVGVDRHETIFPSTRIVVQHLFERELSGDFNAEGTEVAEKSKGRRSWDARVAGIDETAFGAITPLVFVR
jgi:hypothetical protein